MLRSTVYISPIGPLLITEEAGYITKISFLPEDHPLSESDSSPLLELAKAQLSEYFAGKRKIFDLPLRPAGTGFQTKVWDALRAIPFGETRSYGDIARAVGNPKACRAVGMANNKNPIAIVIPCHRVIGADGSLVGYGSGLDRKRFLLSLEQK